MSLQQVFSLCDWYTKISSSLYSFLFPPYSTSADEQVPLLTYLLVKGAKTQGGVQWGAEIDYIQQNNFLPSDSVDFRKYSNNQCRSILSPVADDARVLSYIIPSEEKRTILY